MKKLLFILIFLTTPALAEEKVDYVNLGATLLKDDYIQRAKAVLEKADVTRKDFDFARYYSLKGILLHKLSYPTLSNIFIDEAIKRGQDNPSILLYKAKNYWLLQDYAKVIETLDKAGNAAKESPQFFVIKAESFKQQDKFEEAWAVLDEGIALFPDASLFYRQKFYYLLELGFYKTALDYAQKYLQSKRYSAKDYLAVAYSLRENHQLDAAAVLLEEAVIKYGDDEKLIELLGQVYIDQEKYIMAALVFDWAAIKHPKFSQKAATLYLKAKQPIRSLQLNRRISKQKDKFKQRLGIDLYLEDYESLVTEIAALKRYDLLSDDNIVYAIGYGYFQIGDYANAKKYLKQISDSRLFAKASNIFQQIEKCQDEPFECY
jgi:tetratricopeptide (TPR) repeat protein